MGMIYSALDVAVVMKQGSPILLHFELDNEEQVYLTKRKDLFTGVKNKKAFLSAILDGFRSEWDDSEITEFITDFDVLGNYRAFSSAVAKCKISDIHAVVLMTEVEKEYSAARYHYEWVKYTLGSDGISDGADDCNTQEGAEKMLKSLAVEDVELPISEAPPIGHKELLPSAEPEFPLEARLAISREQWMEKFGTYLEKSPDIRFEGCSFVLSGMEAIGDELEISIEDEITSRGGVVRKSISGKTNYLVVDPSWSGESKAKAAIEQQAKGKPVKIVLGLELIAAFNRNDAEENVIVSESSVAGYEEPSCGNEVSADPMQGMDVTNDAVNVYFGNAAHVVIPEGITAINDFAFTNTDSLQTLSLPDTLTKIGSGAFDGCSSLTGITLPALIEEIPSHAFSNCAKLKGVSLPSSLRTIGEYAFSGCAGLTAVAIPDQVEQIGEGAFAFCEKLTQVCLPKTLNKISSAMFNGCKKLSRIELPTKLTEIASMAFLGCASLEQVILPVTLEEIGEMAFASCGKLRDVHISPFVKKIHRKAFLLTEANCTFHVIKGSYAERYCQENHFTYDYKLASELLMPLQAMAQAQKEEAERRHREEERRLEKLHQQQLAAQRRRYAEIMEAISCQMQIISQNKGWFGTQAQLRKAAQEQLKCLQEQLTKEFPDGKP